MDDIGLAAIMPSDAVGDVSSGKSSSLASRVSTSTLRSPRSAARASMNCFCVRELETAVMRALG